jgi:hypothetical protein
MIVRIKISLYDSHADPPCFSVLCRCLFVITYNKQNRRKYKMKNRKMKPNSLKQNTNNNTTTRITTILRRHSTKLRNLLTETEDSIGAQATRGQQQRAVVVVAATTTAVDVSHTRDLLPGNGLWSLPREIGIVASKVTVVGGLLVDWTTQVELADDCSGAQVKVLVDQREKLVVALLASAVGVDVHRQWLGHTDGVRHLHQDAVDQTGSDQRLGDPARSIGARAVDLAGVLAREATASVGTPTTVCVDDDLATSETGITLRTTDDELARGVQVVDGLVVQVMRWNGTSNDDIAQRLLDLLLADIWCVLGRDHNGVYTNGCELCTIDLVLNSNLLFVFCVSQQRTRGISHTKKILLL